MNLVLKIPNETEFNQVCSFIAAFELDNRELKQEQFIIALREKILVGFGRLRKHNDCTELCSLGVVTNYRRQGIGKALVKALIQQEKPNLYLVCIIPNFFIPIGFKTISENIPDSITDKIDYCTNELFVPEQYVAMKFIDS